MFPAIPLYGCQTGGMICNSPLGCLRHSCDSKMLSVANDRVLCCLLHHKEQSMFREYLYRGLHNRQIVQKLRDEYGSAKCSEASQIDRQRLARTLYTRCFCKFNLAIRHCFLNLMQEMRWCPGPQHLLSPLWHTIILSLAEIVLLLQVSKSLLYTTWRTSSFSSCTTGNSEGFWSCSDIAFRPHLIPRMFQSFCWYKFLEERNNNVRLSPVLIATRLDGSAQLWTTPCFADGSLSLDPVVLDVSLAQ